MKTTKRQLRRIIKEEKQRILQEAINPPNVSLFSAYYDEVWDLVDNQRFLANITDENIDRYDPDTAESIALAMEDVARRVREEIEYESGPPDHWADDGGVYRGG
jgi:hypothetical protein